MSDRFSWLVMRSDGHCSDPVGMVGPVFLDERLVIDSVREPVQHQRSVLDERYHLGRDREIVLDQVGLCDSLFLPHQLLKIRENYPAPVKLNNLLRLLQSSPNPSSYS